MLENLQYWIPTISAIIIVIGYYLDKFNHPRKAFTMFVISLSSILFVEIVNMNKKEDNSNMVEIDRNFDSINQINRTIGDMRRAYNTQIEGLENQLKSANDEIEKLKDKLEEIKKDN